MTKNSNETERFFGRCCMCRKEIPFGSTYFLCSVKTCNLGKTRLYFCSPECFEAHLPTARHRNASCIQEQAPPKPDPPK